VRVWIDLSNSPHVQIFGPVVDRLRQLGHEVVLTARDHAQTIELARRRWPDVVVVGRQSPAGALAKAASTLTRARALVQAVEDSRPDVALSHGSYAQLLAARRRRLPAVTMMDYEYQPANHLSFRLANRVMVPETFPARELRRAGAHSRKVVRYAGFKEELYLAGFQPSRTVLDDLGVDQATVLAVLRPPPAGALYHRFENTRFEEIVAHCAARTDVHTVLLPRSAAQREQFKDAGVTIPAAAPDALSLASFADVVVGAGGTMNREADLLGASTYTLFAGKLAAVDAELMRLGYMQDLRAAGGLPRLEPRVGPGWRVDADRGRATLEAVVATVEDAAQG